MLRGIALFGLQASENNNSEEDMKVCECASRVAHSLVKSHLALVLTIHCNQAVHVSVLAWLYTSCSMSMCCARRVALQTA